jgi:hypothetical protein
MRVNNRIGLGTHKSSATQDYSRIIRDTSTDNVKEKLNRVKKLQMNMEKYGGISIKYKGGGSRKFKEDE